MTDFFVGSASHTPPSLISFRFLRRVEFIRLDEPCDIVLEPVVDTKTGVYAILSPPCFFLPFAAGERVFSLRHYVSCRWLF
jgi:hypothetical protein